MKRTLAILAAAAAVLACRPAEKTAASAAPAAGETPYVLAASQLEAGRHLTIVGGCNDCHTAGYAQNGGQTPQSEWLKGNPNGHYGPWGTSYASNLRIVAAGMTEDAWVEMMRTREGLPPMPWSIMHAYSERDTRALYAFIRSLGEPGQAVPTALPPGAPPNGPYTDYLTHAGPPPT